MAKKALFLTIVLCLVVALMTVTAFAADTVESGTCGEGVTWTLDGEGVLTISGSGEITDLIWDDDYFIKEVIIEEGVFLHEPGLFMFHPELGSVTLPSTMTTIPGDTFVGCSMAEITIPEGVTSIGGGAFQGCNDLVDIHLPNSLVSIGPIAFSQCDALASITVPKGVKVIDAKAFSSCRNLTNVRFCGSAPNIGDGAFGDYYAEMTITAYYPLGDPSWTPDVLQNYGGDLTWVPYDMETEVVTSGTCGDDTTWVLDTEGRLTISGAGAMETYAYGSAPWYGYRKAISSVVVEDSVTGISEGAFHGLSTVEEMVLPFVGGCVKGDQEGWQYPFGYIFGTVAYEGGRETAQAFYQGNIEETYSVIYYIPTSVKSITITDGEILCNAFQNCVDLVEVELPEGIGKIRNGAFMKCRSLTSVYIPQSVTEIWWDAFKGCTDLAYIYLPDGLLQIRQNAFRGCASLKEIVIPEKVTYLDSGLFMGCEALEKVIFRGSPPKMTWAFEGATVTAYYPLYDPAWTEDVLQDYHGTVTWVSYNPGTAITVLELAYPSLSFENEVRYNVYFTVSDMEQVAKIGVAVFNQRLTDGTVDDAVAVTEGYETDGTLCMVHTGGIAAVDMGDTVYFRVYAQLVDGRYVYSPVAGYNAVAYARSVLKDADEDLELRALVVALLEYGAEAQRYFGHNTGDLMDAFLTDDQRALTAVYADSMVEPLLAVDPVKTAAFVRDSYAYERLYATVSFDASFRLNYYFTPTMEPDAEMWMYHWDQDTYEAQNRLYLVNATGSMEMKAFANGRYWCQISDIAPKDMFKTVFVVGNYTVDTVGYCTGVIPYSVGQYCKSLAADDSSDQQALAKATVVYGYHAKAYFAG